MNYVDGSLLPGEQVTFRTSLHKIMFVAPIFCALLLLGLLPIIPWEYPVLAVTALMVIYYFIYASSEFAVTNKRLIIKVGVFKRRTLEMLLSKVETVSVTQGIFGRIFGYGTIVVIGTGGTNEPFKQIAHPLEFRRAVQAATI